MLSLIKKIREYTEAGIILNHMYLFDELEATQKMKAGFSQGGLIPKPKDEVAGTVHGAEFRISEEDARKIGLDSITRCLKRWA